VPLVGWLISLRLRRRRAADRSGRGRPARALVADTASVDTDHPALLEQPTSRTRVTVIA
jgi:hypothetical protein